MGPFTPATPLLLILLSAFANGLKLTSLTNDHPYADIEHVQLSHEGIGVDASFPTHHGILEDTGRMEVYTSFIHQCREKMGAVGYLCDASERGRMDANLFQPPLMKNYTELGFKKITTPPKLHESLASFYQTANVQEESWGRQNDQHATTHFNHWEASSQLVNFNEDASQNLRNFVWDETQAILQQWSGVNLSPSSMYGRVYSNQSIIPPHVDAEPMVISAIIRVSQDVKEPWLIEVIGHNGKSYNISLGEGEMLVYEGASVIHGMPYPMNGVHVSDLFVHFEPVGHYMNQPPLDEDGHTQESLEDLYEQALSKAKEDRRSEDGQNMAALKLTSHPDYIEAGSLYAKRWMQTHERTKLRFILDTTNLNAHTAASAGDLEALIALAEKDPKSIKKVDNNGWTPLHEAVRSDNLEVLKWLVSQGLDYNLRTHHGDGGSPLWWAKKYHGKDSKVVKYLEAKGAIDVPPDKEMK